MKIYIIGFMGSGKSTLGRPIARAMDCQFIDLDHYIEEQEKMTISEIFAQKGETYFRDRENHYLCQVSQLDNMVISTGGGTPCFGDNMEFMRSCGTTIYLKHEPRTLASRLSNAKVKRPLIANKSPQELMEFIEQTLAQREIYYNKASIIVADPDRDAKRIINILKLEK